MEEKHRRQIKNNRFKRFSATFLLLGIVLLTLLSLQFASAFNWDDQIVAYYTFNESSGNAVDVTGNISDIVINGATRVAGEIGNGVLFTGKSGSNGDMPLNDSLGGTNLTQTMWINVTGSTGNNQFILHKDSTGANGDYFLRVQTDRTLQFGIEGGGSPTCTSTATITYNKYHFVGITLNDTNMTIWLDGVMVKHCDSKDGYLDIVTEGSPDYTLGSFFQGNSNFFNGTIDELGFWSKELNESEMVELNTSISYNPININTNLETPANSGSFTTTEAATINFTSNYTSSGGVDLDNVTYFIWNSSDDEVNRTTITIDGTTNRTSIIINASVLGDYKWNALACGKSGSNTKCSFQPTNRTFSVENLVFGLCNASLTQEYLNISFKNESTNSHVSASIPLATFVYWQGNQSINNTFSFTNNTEQADFNLCFSPTDKETNITYTIQYTNSESQQRIFTNTEALTNASTDRILYLLATGDGLFVTFQVLNTADQVVSDVFVNVTRTIGSEVLLETGTTNAAGLVTFFLNPNFEHTFVFSKAGFTTTTTSLFPTQSSYTIEMGAGVVSTGVDLNKGITFRTEPTITELINQTSYEFNFIIASSFWTIEEFGFVLRNETDTLGSVTETSSGGTANIPLSSGNHSLIIMNYFWTINGTTLNGTRIWTVFNSDSSGWSIKTLFTDLSNYMDDGLFGLDNFGLALITFLMIFVVTGIMSFKFGFTSPVAISAFLFTLVVFADYGLNLLDNLKPIGALPSLPTVIVGLIMVGLIAREGFK